VFDLLRAKYGTNLKYEFDGVYFEWQDWWFSVRASNTENLVRLNLEATNESLMTEKTNEVKLLITS
jgi:phosphomannomutase